MEEKERDDSDQGAKDLGEVVILRFYRVRSLAGINDYSISLHACPNSETFGTHRINLY